ncbi:hypothetical protein S2M10_33000 [Sphingomonas sp. S2M10]|uniref:helix-turn-helix domain-containing protein n=1 Tax=Sphingomonas sp. S2M10 TaxID=2705010 RepID=UPI001456D74E|nr:helix-turn-helix domain-containing protein [Sphingomonas sp. S2M10]NLS28290.1 hypothetical protein [Sphingomonas sp. S2M10]
MTEGKFLTPEEVAERYRDAVSVGTLRNWRLKRYGPAFLKIGRTILYPVEELDAWDKRNTVICRAPQGLIVPPDDRV